MMSAILSFDTLKYANRLKQANVPPEQAEMQAEVMKEVLEAAFQTAELATKSDVLNAIAIMRKDTEVIEERLAGKMDVLKKEMDAQGNRLTIRIVGILIGALGTLQIAIALFQHFSR